jgi:hypothetical protein
MKFKNPVKLDSFKKQKYHSDGFVFEIGKQGEKLDKSDLSVEKKMSSYFLQNDKGSTESLGPHLATDKDFKKSMKLINERAFKV